MCSSRSTAWSASASCIRQVKRNNRAQAGDVLILGKPLGVGILSAALKKGVLSARRLRADARRTTQLNTPGTALARVDRRACDDRRHRLRPGRPSARNLPRLPARRAAVRIRRDLPVIDGGAAVRQQGMVTGASARNWAGYGAEMRLPEGAPDWQQRADYRSADQRRPAGGLLGGRRRGGAGGIQETGLRCGVPHRADGRRAGGIGRLAFKARARWRRRSGASCRGRQPASCACPLALPRPD